MPSVEHFALNLGRGPDTIHIVEASILKDSPIVYTVYLNENRVGDICNSIADARALAMRTAMGELKQNMCDAKGIMKEAIETLVALNLSPESNLRDADPFYLAQFLVHTP